MRAYIIVTIVVFALIVLAHVARLFAEGAGVLSQPVFVVTSIMSIALTAWGISLLVRKS